MVHYRQFPPNRSEREVPCVYGSSLTQYAMFTSAGSSMTVVGRSFRLQTCRRSRPMATTVHFYQNKQLELWANKEAKRLTLRQLVCLFIIPFYSHLLSRRSLDGPWTRSVSSRQVAPPDFSFPIHLVPECKLCQIRTCGADCPSY